jgi:hypothetical protein
VSEVYQEVLAEGFIPGVVVGLLGGFALFAAMLLAWSIIGRAWTWRNRQRKGVAGGEVSYNGGDDLAQLRAAAVPRDRRRFVRWFARWFLS